MELERRRKTTLVAKLRMRYQLGMQFRRKRDGT